MTTAEYLKQKGNELLDFIGIKPTSSLVIKTLKGEVLTIEHRLPKAKEKEFIASYLKDNTEIPAVLIERVQFPNKLNGAEAISLDNKIKSNQIDSYSRNNEYIFETNFGISYSHNDWKKQHWSPNPVYDKGSSEYLIAVRNKKTPDKTILGYSTHSTKEEIESYLQGYNLNNNDIELNIYKIYDTNDSDYKRAKEADIQRYLDDPRNKVEFLERIEIPETVLVYSNDKDYNYELYSGESMLMDYYTKNYDKTGTLYVCKTNDLNLFSDNLSINQPLGSTLNVDIEKQLFVPEVNFYIQSCILNNLEVDSKMLTNETVKKHTQEFYADFRMHIDKQGIEDIKRDNDYIFEAIINQPKTIDFLDKKEKIDGNMWQKLLASDASLINFMPKELITFELLNKVNNYEPTDIYKYLPSNFNSEQIVKLIDKDLKNVNAIDDNGRKLMTLINALPKEVKNKNLISELHNTYDKTTLSKELAYSLVVLGLEINQENAINAVEHFKNNRFITEYDPIGADDSWGQVCGGEYYTNRNMLNPADKFEPDQLTIKQWHDIASQDTKMLEFIPESIIKEEAFWENYQDFIGKGGYLNNPDNEYCMDKFDEYQVFSKMPEHLKTNPDICLDLLEKKAISISFINNPSEDHFLLVDPQDYDRIPLDLREKDSFKDLALKAFNINKWEILKIPKRFITKEMVSEALSHDMGLCNNIPIHYLSEELLCDKIKNYEHQGAFSEISKSGEHPQYIELELSDHKKVLQYVPEELKTDLVCQAALKANPENAAFLPINHLSNSRKVPEQLVENRTNITLNDLISDNSLKLRELNKDEIDILHKIQMSGRVVSSNISEGNKEFIDKYFSQDNKELITAIENDDSGMIADIEGRRRLTAGEILESKGIIPGGSTAKTLEEEGYKVELLKSKINSKTENYQGVDKTNMKAVNNNDPMTGKKQSVPLNTLGEVKTAQKSQGKMNTNSATGNILHSNHKDKLSNSNKISKSQTNDRDSNRKRRGHKL